jgi:glucosylglycerate synthase
MTRAVEPLRRAEIVVAVHGSSDPAEAVRTGRRVSRQLGAAYRDRKAVVLLLSPAEESPAIEPVADADPVPIVPWSRSGQNTLEAMLRAAEAFDAGACALVAADGEESPTDGARHLLAPILDEGFDLVCPCYATHRFDGVLTTGIVYPLTRAVFGRRLRQPIGDELAVSRSLASHLLGEAWQGDAAHAGDRIWLVTVALSRDFRVCQSQLGARPRYAPEADADLAASLAHVVGLLFHEMRMYAPVWQRVKGSRIVKTYGNPAPPGGEARQPQIAALRSAFQLGFQELGRLWGAVLPPQTLLGLKRLTRAAEESFSFDDALWARIVYDFAVGYHLARMDRALLLRSMTPLYLGWVASFVREVRELEPAAVEARVERLCRAFEVSKPYLISRWRWPDRFNP